MTATTNQNTPFKNKREAMLDLIDVADGSVFSYAQRLMLSLKHETIDSRNYELLCGELQLHCLREKISTSIEHDGKVIFSLF